MAAPGDISGKEANRIDLSARLEEWRRLLLDTSKRSRLVNSKFGRGGVLGIEHPDFYKLWEQFAVESKPAEFPWPSQWIDIDEQVKTMGEEGLEERPSDPRVLSATQLAAIKQTPELNNETLLTNLPDKPLDGRLKRLALVASTSLSEQGVNSLFLAFGFLQWFESADSDVPILSPLVLLPVSLRRKSADSTWELAPLDDDVASNHPLAEILRADFRLTLPQISEDELSESSAALESLLSQIESVIAGHDRWQVQRKVGLGTFAFQKISMWQHLGKNADRITGHPLCRGIAGDSSQMPTTDMSDVLNSDLDQTVPPETSGASLKNIVTTYFKIIKNPAARAGIPLLGVVSASAVTYEMYRGNGPAALGWTLGYLVLMVVLVVVQRIQKGKDSPWVKFAAIIFLYYVLLMTMGSGMLLATSFFIGKPLDFRPKTARATDGLLPDSSDENDSIHEAQREELLSEFETAMTLYEKAIQKHGENFELLFGMGRAYEGLGRIQDAEKYFKKALAIQPNNPQVLRDLGMLLYDPPMNRYSEAVGLLKHLVESNPDYPDGQYVLGQACLRAWRASVKVDSPSQDLFNQSVNATTRACENAAYTYSNQALYNLACLYAIRSTIRGADKEHDQEIAINYLGEAFARTIANSSLKKRDLKDMLDWITPGSAVADPDIQKLPADKLSALKSKYGSPV
jgi:tetratricopeptide (TPR) repeat protein